MSIFFKKRWIQPKSAPGETAFFTRFFFDWFVPYAATGGGTYLLARSLLSEKYVGQFDREKLLFEESHILIDRIQAINTPYVNLLLLMLILCVLISKASETIVFNPRTNLRSIFRKRESKQLSRFFYWGAFLFTKIFGYMTSLICLALAFANAAQEIAIRYYTGSEQSQHLMEVHAFEKILVWYLAAFTMCAFGTYMSMYRGAKPSNFLVLSITNKSSAEKNWNVVFHALQKKADFLTELTTGFWTQYLALERNGQRGITVITYGGASAERPESEKLLIIQELKKQHIDWKEMGYDFNVTGLEAFFPLKEIVSGSFSSDINSSGQRHNGVVGWNLRTDEVEPHGENLKRLFPVKISWWLFIAVSGIAFVKYITKVRPHDV
jgi:hypothetical protein